MSEPAGITVEEVKQRLDDGETIVFLDSRSARAWREGAWQIPASRRVAPDNVDDYLDTLPRHGLVVPYCTCPQDMSARQMAGALQQRGVIAVRPLIGGLYAWLEAGYPSVPAPGQKLTPDEAAENIWKAESGAEADADITHCD